MSAIDCFSCLERTRLQREVSQMRTAGNSVRIAVNTHVPYYPDRLSVCESAMSRPLFKSGQGQNRVFLCVRSSRQAWSSPASAPARGCRRLCEIASPESSYLIYVRPSRSPPLRPQQPPPPTAPATTANNSTNTTNNFNNSKQNSYQTTTNSSNEENLLV